MRIAIIFSALVLLSGCDANLPQAKDNTRFDIPALVDELTGNMSARQFSVDKSFTLNGKTEQQKITAADSAFWARELARLKEVDLNAPQYRDNLIVTDKPDSLSNLQVRVFTLKEQKNLPLKKLQLFYLDNPGEIRQVHLELATKNFIADSKTTFTVWLNRYNDKLLIDSLKTAGSDKVILQPTRVYQTVSKTVWP